MRLSEHENDTTVPRHRRQTRTGSAASILTVTGGADAVAARLDAGEVQHG